MPTNDLSARLEWNEENFAKVVADLYKEIEADQDLRRRLLANPFEVLSTKINIPEDFRGGIFARPKYQKTLMLNVPLPAASREELPEGTTEAQSYPDYEPICTFPVPW